MVNGLKILTNLSEVSGSCNEYIFHNANISKTSLLRGIKLYNIGIRQVSWQFIITRLYKANLSCVDDLRNRLKPDSDSGKGEWIDLSGLIAPKNEIEKSLMLLKMALFRG